jgi:PAS domain S-box-containing protein
LNRNGQPNSFALAQQPEKLSWESVFRALLPPALASALCIGAAQIHYLLFHTLAEFFSIIIALTAMVVASTSFRFTRSHFTVYVAVAIGWCAALDLIHTVTYKGMNLLEPENYGLATQFWIAARFVQALALLSSPLFLLRSVSLNPLHAGFGLTALAVTVWIFSGTFPEAYIEGQGLTPFKIYAEYLIILMLGATSLLLWRRRVLMSSRLFLTMQAALAMMMLSEFAFTRYVSLYGDANTVGHIFKIFAYWFVYLALAQSTLREPFSMLSRSAGTYDAVPDPTLLVGANGLIFQANQAAARYAGTAAHELIGRSVHPLFHAPWVSFADCPVCGRIARGEAAFSYELYRGAEAGIVECTVAPFYTGGSDPSYVQVVRYITERKELVAERELLVRDLDKRIKELRCLYVISNLCQMADRQIPELLSDVAQALPLAFLFPDKVRVSIVSDWGTFGVPGSEDVRRCMERELRVDGQIVGKVWVCYPDDARAKLGHFLPEEHELLETVTQRVGEAIGRIQSEAKVKRLTYLYDMLSATNRAIVRCRSYDELLAAVFEVLIRHSAFPKLFIALSDNGVRPLRIVHSHGIDGEHLGELRDTLSRSDSPFAQALAQFRDGGVFWIPVPADPLPGGWEDYLAREGIHERAVLPLIRDGQLFGVVGLYAQSVDAFDPIELKLLNEMAADLAFALNGIAANERHLAAEQRADISESRFYEVFEASPAPMQIRSISTRSVRAINRAHQQWLGYSVSDFASEDDWFDAVYADADVRRQMREHWPQDIEMARTLGAVVHSPEIRLRCKDGSERIAQGTMTVVGDDAVIAWTDLTDIRRNEQALQKSEQHFRGMIEQTLTGVYVVRDRLLVYANPRFCEIVGLSSEEMVGKDILDIIGADAQFRRRVAESRRRLHAGERGVFTTMSFQRKDGVTIDLSVHPSLGRWDGQDAVIVMVQDIAEGKRAEERSRAT